MNGSYLYAPQHFGIIVEKAPQMHLMVELPYGAQDLVAKYLNNVLPPFILQIQAKVTLYF